MDAHVVGVSLVVVTATSLGHAPLGRLKSEVMSVLSVITLLIMLVLISFGVRHKFFKQHTYKNVSISQEQKI